MTCAVVSSIPESCAAHTGEAGVRAISSLRGRRPARRPYDVTSNAGPASPIREMAAGTAPAQAIDTAAAGEGLASGGRTALAPAPGSSSYDGALLRPTAWRGR
jgi:hypothetical protein